jgi:NADPH:quinone reductase
MKALMCTEYGAPERLSVQDIASPKAGPGQVVIDVKSSALNFPDALMVQGLYQVKPPLPFTPGGELAGVITEIGEGVTGYKVNDRVIAFPGTGGFAEECAVDAAKLMPLPPDMDFEQGSAFLVAYCTSLRALKDCAYLKRGETLLVLGAAGGVGVAAIEIAKAMGARVIAAASSADKLALCRELGADETIDYSTEDLRKRALDLTAGKGVDVVFDPVGGAYTESALRATAWRGRLVVVGFANGEIPKIPLNLALLKERAIVGVYWGESVLRDPAAHVANVKQLLAWFTQGKLKPVISERVSIADTPAALTRFLQRKVKGKLVVLPES